MTPLPTSPLPNPDDEPAFGQLQSFVLPPLFWVCIWSSGCHFWCTYSLN